MPWHIFVGLRVSDLGASRTWHERLLGTEPTFAPNDTEGFWDLADNRVRKMLYRGPDGSEVGFGGGAQEAADG